MEALKKALPAMEGSLQLKILQLKIRYQALTSDPVP